MNKEIHLSSNKIAKSLHVFKINKNLDTAPPLRFSFSNFTVTSPTSQLILQPFRRFTYAILQPFRHFTYVTAHSPTLPLLNLRHSSFSNPSFASPTSQALHLIHLASRSCFLIAILPSVERSFY